MSWTYNSSNLGNSSMDDVRLRIGDVSSGDQQLANEEITYILGSVTSNVVLASIECCDLLAARYARYADTRNEGLDVKASQRFEHYRQLAATLRRQANSVAEVFVGGLSLDTKEDRAEDTDLVQPSFYRDRDTYPSTIASSTEG